MITTEALTVDGEVETELRLTQSIVQPESTVRDGGWRVPGIPLVWSACVVIIGLFYLFGWDPLVHHHSQWTTGHDLWGIFRAAHYVGWGFFGGIYDPSTGVNTFPGMSVVLAPVAMLSGALGLSESALGVAVPHPAAALLLQPVELLLACSVLFAADSLASRLGVRISVRWWLIGAIAVVAWPVAALWGHAEDVLAVTFALVAIRILLDGKSRRSGWLLGLGIAFQPLVGFLLPVAVAVCPTGRRLKFLLQAAIPSAVLIALAFAGNFSQAYRALVKQPTPPALNHATPWVALAPHVGSTVIPSTTTGLQLGGTNGHFRAIAGLAHNILTPLVSGGPVRTIGLLCAVVIGVIAWRKRPDASGIVWLCALALTMRCCFDPVMTPYYLAPPLIVALIAAARMGRLRFGIAAVVALADTVFAYYRLSPWAWWIPVVGMLAVVLACGYPGRRHLIANGIADESLHGDGVEVFAPTIAVAPAVKGPSKRCRPRPESASASR